MYVCTAAYTSECAVHTYSSLSWASGCARQTFPEGVASTDVDLAALIGSSNRAPLRACAAAHCTALQCALLLPDYGSAWCLLLQDVLNDVLVVGEALGMQQQAAAAVAALQQRMDNAKALVAQLPPLEHLKV